MDDTVHIREAQYAALVAGLAEQQLRLELLISLTPTGPARNALCNANIRVSAALSALEDPA
jgi:hypothetical protein